MPNHLLKVAQGLELGKAKNVDFVGQFLQKDFAVDSRKHFAGLHEVIRSHQLNSLQSVKQLIGLYQGHDVVVLHQVVFKDLVDLARQLHVVVIHGTSLLRRLIVAFELTPICS